MSLIARLRAHLKKRRVLAIRAETRAEALIAEHGQTAWALVYRKCRDQELALEDRLFHYRVRAAIERRLGIPPRVDTATRYLERRRPSSS